MRVITYGTFDLFHHGHLNLLRRATEMGEVIVGLSTDEFNKIKGKECVQTYRERRQNVAQINGIIEIIPEESWEQKAEDIKRYNIDIMVMGDDWKGEFDYLDCEVVYLPRTEGISTTEIKKILKQ